MEKISDIGDQNGETVMNILYLSPTHFVSNIDVTVFIAPGCIFSNSLAPRNSFYIGLIMIWFLKNIWKGILQIKSQCMLPTWAVWSGQ